MNIPIATSDLTRGLASEDTYRRLQMTLISAFSFSIIIRIINTITDVDPISRRFPSAKTAEAMTGQDLNKYL